MGKTKFVSVLLIVVILSALSACATTTARKGSSIIPGREATEIWHSYEILPNYHYYYSGPDTQPNYLIGIDDRYKLMSKLWNAAPTTLLLRRLLDNRQILKYDGAVPVGKGG